MHRAAGLLGAQICMGIGCIDPAHVLSLPCSSAACLHRSAQVHVRVWGTQLCYHRSGETHVSASLSGAQTQRMCSQSLAAVPPACIGLLKCMCVCGAHTCAIIGRVMCMRECLAQRAGIGRLQRMSVCLAHKDSMSVCFARQAWSIPLYVSWKACSRCPQ